MSETVSAFLAECQELDDLVAGLDAADWRADTPAPGWSVAHQIAHLAWTDEVATLAATRPEAFEEEIARALADERYVDHAAQDRVNDGPEVLLRRWRTGRERLAEALRAVEPGTKIPWFGPPMSSRSMATARLMETWAHGQDVYDALGRPHPATERLRDVAHLGVRTRDFAYTLHGRDLPAEEFRIELSAPSGECWSWGPEGRAADVTGPAQDFCLVVTQRRAVDETALAAHGEAAAWLRFAQAFAGRPTTIERR